MHDIVVPSRPPKVAAAPLIVEARRSLAALADVRADLERLSARSTRRCPFSTPTFLARAVEEDEFLAFDGRDASPLLLLAWEGSSLKGFLPLRERAGRVEPLLTHDVERPDVVAFPGDEERVARAFVEHLCFERRAPFVDFVGVEPTSVLARACEAVARSAKPGAKRRFRTVEGPPLSVIPTGSFPSIDAYFAALSKKMRGNVSRFARRLFAAGEPTWIEADGSDPRALEELFEIYLSIEARSWKQRAKAGIARHEKRVRFFRRMIAERSCPRPWIGVLLLDGAPIAAMISASHEGRSWALEMAYDEKHGDLGPGQLLLLLSIRRAIEERAATYNLMASYAYYKQRWLADVVPTCSAQLLKVGSRPFYRALLGDLRREVARRIAADAPKDFNEDKRRVQDEVDDDPAGRAQATARAAALTTSGAKLRVETADDLARALPFLRVR